MSGNFYEVFENGRRRASLTSQEESDFFASCLEIRMFNVGEGEAILLIPPRSRNAWLMDCGCHHNKDLGEALADYLAAEDLLLKGLILSHPHLDHGGAIKTALENAPLARSVRYFRSDDAFFSAEKVWLGDLTTVMRRLGSRMARPVIVRQGIRNVDLGNGVRARLFAGKPVSAGYTSIFLNLHFGDARLLFTGDVKCGYEIKLLKQRAGAEFRADVLKVTHHGASSGTANRLVCAVKPGIAFASTAADGGHRLEGDVLGRLGGRPGPRKVLETFVDGDIIIKTHGRSLNGRVLYHVDRKRPGQFAKKLGAQTSLLRNVVRGRTKHTNCEKAC